MVPSLNCMIYDTDIPKAIANMQSRKRRLATIGWNQESDSPHDQALDDLKVRISTFVLGY